MVVLNNKMLVDWRNVMKLTGGSIALIFTMIGGLYAFDSVYARRADIVEIKSKVMVVASSLQQHVFDDSYDRTYDKVWEMKQEHMVQVDGHWQWKPNVPNDTKVRYKELNDKLKAIAREQRRLYKGTGYKGGIR